MIFDRIKNFFSSLTTLADLQGKVILVIDDGQIERKVYAAVLRKAGCEVVTAEDASSGFATARSRRFDLILLDYALPDGNGIEVCKELKASESTRNIPIVFLTGSVKPEGVISCYDAGADEYLSKPINAAALIKHVRLALGPSGE